MSRLPGAAREEKTFIFPGNDVFMTTVQLTLTEAKGLAQDSENGQEKQWPSEMALGGRRSGMRAIPCEHWTFANLGFG